MENIILKGNSIDELKKIESETIDCCITSPPYFSLRDYDLDDVIWDEDKNCEHDFKNKFCLKCNAWKGQLGLEPELKFYIKHLCDIFDEVKRVLKKEGTCWVNLGDSYNSLSWVGDKKDKFSKCPIAPGNLGRCGQKGFPDKCLLQIPSRFAIEMIDRGWILRNELIWHKPNPMPSSAKDRFTPDFEKIFFFTKNKKYFFNQQFEDAIYPNKKDKRIDFTTGDKRNMRCVWRLATEPSSEEHYAQYPKKLIKIPILAGCPEGGIVLDPFLGSGTTAIVSKDLGRNYLGIEMSDKYFKIASRRLSQERLF